MITIIKVLRVGTDILIGLPGETAESHLNTLSTAFDIGFDGFLHRKHSSTSRYRI